MTYYSPRTTYAQRGICYTDAMGKDRKTSEEIRQAIADRLRALREKHGYKQVDVAAVIGIKQGTYSNYESGKRTPGIDVIYKIAHYYGMTSDEFIAPCVELEPEYFFKEQGDQVLADGDDALIRYIEAPVPPLSRQVKEMLYHFTRLPMDVQREVIDYTIYKKGHKN